MTAEEAIRINKMGFLVDACGNTDAYLIEANRMAVNALDKQMKKKPETYDASPHKVYLCPCCKSTFIMRNQIGMKFCNECGQAIDWSEVE